MLFPYHKSIHKSLSVSCLDLLVGDHQEELYQSMRKGIKTKGYVYAKMAAFIVLSLLALLVVSVVQYVIIMIRVLFSSLIIWRGKSTRSITT